MLGEKHEGVMDGKSVQLNVRVWYDARSGHIKLAGKGLTASTVSNDPDSVRYHPNLYRKLARLLREAGAPAPTMDENNA
jgi:hypothetical protein